MDYKNFLQGFEEPTNSAEEHEEQTLLWENDGNFLEKSGNFTETERNYSEISVFDVELAKSKLDVNSVNELVEKAHSFVIETDEEAQKGLSMALQARDLGRTIEETRKSIVRPHIDFQKSITEFAKDFQSKLKEIEGSLQKKIENYQEKRKQSLKEQGIDDSSFDNLSVDEGSTTTKKAWDFKLDNIALVPLQYLQLNEKLIKEEIKLGNRNIPGIKIFEVEKKQLRLKGRRK